MDPRFMPSALPHWRSSAARRFEQIVEDHYHGSLWTRSRRNLTLRRPRPHPRPLQSCTPATSAHARALPWSISAALQLGPALRAVFRLGQRQATFHAMHAPYAATAVAITAHKRRCQETHTPTDSIMANCLRDGAGRREAARRSVTPPLRRWVLRTVSRRGGRRPPTWPFGG